MKAHLNIGGTATYTLAEALLIYHEKSRTQSFPSNTAVTIHKIECAHGRPVLGPGRPITLAGVESLAQSVGRNLAATWLPPEVISLSFGQLVWWCPAGRRRIWFKHVDQKKLRKINSKFVHHPPLLFVAGGCHLVLHALADNIRPCPDTPLLVAPYFNLSAEGTMCVGSANVPDLPAPASIPDFEAAFFNSAFTHSNQNRLCAHPQGHAGLWAELAGRKTPPDARYWNRNLIRRRQTVKQLLK
jgi:PRTRC genetic system protein B